MKQKADWEKYYLVFEQTDGYKYDLICEGYIPEGNELDCFLYYQYIFFLIIHISVRLRRIPFRGKEVPFVPFTSFFQNAEENYFRLVCGVLKGCGMKLLVSNYIRIHSYENGKSTYQGNEERLTEFLQSCMQNVPREASACWSDEIKSIAEDCAYHSYCIDAGAAVIVWTHERYQEVMKRFKRMGNHERINQLKAIYQQCRNLFVHGYCLEEISIKGNDYFLEIVPASFYSEIWGGLNCGSIFYLSSVFLYHTIVLSDYLTDCELMAGFSYEAEYGKE